MHEDTPPKPRKALNKAFLKAKHSCSDMERFKAHLIALLDQTNDTESEEFRKNLVLDFLNPLDIQPNNKGRTNNHSILSPLQKVHYPQITLIYTNFNI